MARPYGSKNKPQEVKEVAKEVALEVKEQVKIDEVVAIDPNELAHKKAVMDGLESEAKKRDVQAKEVESLERQIAKLKEEFELQVGEFNVKKRINDNLGQSIASATMDLKMIDQKFNEINAEKLAALEKKIKDVESADKEFQELIKSNREAKNLLEAEISQFYQEREQNRQLVHAANSALAQNTAIWEGKLKDIEEREVALKAEEEAFEAYKASLKPEIDRITSLKNDNQALINKLERQTAEIERIRLASVREKELAQEARLSAEAKNAEMRQKVMNDEARLRKWEQDLKDQALELSAKQAEINKELRRQRLIEQAKAE